LKAGREKTFLKQGLIALGAMLGLYVFLINPFLKEGKSMMDEELDRKTLEIKRYVTRTGSLPSKESFDRMEKENSALENKFSELMDFVDPKKTRILESGAEAGLYFIERLHGTMKEFEPSAAEKGVKVPENLGFGDGLPKDSMVEALLRQLETIELILGTLLKSGNIEIYALKPLKSIDYAVPSGKGLFYTELPVQVSIKTDHETLAGLLTILRNGSPVVSVKELHVKNSKESEDLEVSFVASTFMVARPKK